MAKEFDAMLEGPNRLAAMREHAQAVGRPNAAMEIARKILDDFNFTNNSHETND
jgi:UDP-N-acetylglucosamine:LPS N-acetylglucosamine transferase